MRRILGVCALRGDRRRWWDEWFEEVFGDGDVGEFGEGEDVRWLR
jgi:hypothetical protein